MSRSEPFAATDTRRWLHSAAAIRIAGLVVSMAYSAIVVWGYVHQPQTIAEGRGTAVAAFFPDACANKCASRSNKRTSATPARARP